MIITLLSFIFGLVILHFCILHFGKNGRMINSIPGPQALPIVGNMHSLQLSSSEIWTYVRKMSAQYYPIFRLWSFSSAYLNIRHPDDIEALLGNPKQIKKSYLYTILEPWFNTGLLTGAGKKWHTRRKILTPAFHFNLLQQFVDVFIDEGEHLIQSLKSEGGPVVKDLMPFISEHTLNMICETAMGTKLKDKGNFQYEYRKAVYDMGSTVVYRLVRPWFCYNFFFNLCPEGWRQIRVLKILHGFTRKIIQERKEYHARTDHRYLTGFKEIPNKKDDNDANIEIRRKRLAMLDLLLAAHRNNQIDDEGIREEVDTFMFRGHDTTAVSICFTIMLLAEHKEIQARARAEVKNLMQENEGKLNIAALQNLPYLERCIKESLRLYPSVPLISRAPEMDVKLSNYLIPASTIIHVHIIDVHRDPRYWPNPEVFDPDRFLPENTRGRHPYAYIPFSAGPRNCIGQRFAMLELKATLALLLHNFFLEPVDYLKDLSIDSDLVIRSTNPLRTKFVPIDTC